MIYKNGLVDWKAMEKKAKEMLADLGMDIDVNSQVQFPDHSEKTDCGNLQIDYA